MKYWWGAAGVLVAVVAGWFLSRGGSGTAPATGVPRVRDGRAAAQQAPASGRRIAGRVERGGAPVAGATVQLTSEAGEVQRIAGADGRFDFGPQPVRAYVVSAQVPASSGAVQAVDLRRAEVVADDLRLVLSACEAEVHGLVRDVSGGAIPNARVAHSLDDVLGDLSTLTGADGSYALCLPPEEGSLLVSADGYATLVERTPISGHMRHDIELPPEALVHGRVVHAGAPVAGAEVRLAPPLMATTLRAVKATSDTEGRFQLAGALPGTYELAATAEGLATPRKLAVTARVGGGSELVVELAPAFTLEGRVIDEGTRKGAADVAVWLMREQEPMGDTRTDADGAFSFTSLPPGEYALRPEVDSHAYPPVALSASVRGVLLPIAPRVEISGRILRDGQPVEGADVSSTGTRAKSGRDGRYALVLARGAHDIHAESPHAAARKAVDVDTPRRDVDIELDLAASIAGTVVDQDGAPVPGVLVECLEKTMREYAAGGTGDDGTFIVRPMAGGRHECAVGRSDHLQRYPLVDGTEAAAFALADGTTALAGVRLAIRVEHQRLAGRVVDEAGAPAPDVEVVAASIAGVTTTYSDANGAFRFRDLSTGTYRLQARGPHGSAILDGVTAGRTDVVLVFPATGRVEGKLVGFARTPRVSLFGRDAVLDGPMLAVADNAFHVDALAAGDYRVIASGRDILAEGEVTVVVGQTSTITLTGTATGRIEGTLRVAAGRDPGLIPCVARSNGHAAYGESTESGAYVISWAFAGPNVVTCGRDPTKHEVDVVAGQTAHLDLAVEVRTDTKVHLGFALEEKNKQVFVSAVEPDGVAARAGMMVGDRVVRFMGVKLVTPSSDLIELFEELAATQPLELQLERAGNTLDAILAP